MATSIKGIQGAMRIPADAAATWGGRVTVPQAAGAPTYTFTNTFIFNSDSIIHITPQELNAAHMVLRDSGAIDGVRASCSDNGTLTITHATGISGVGVFHMAVFAGPGTVITLA